MITSNMIGRALCMMMMANSLITVLPYFTKSEKNLNLEGLNRVYHGVNGKLSVSRYPYIDKPSIMMTDALHERGLPIRDFNAAHQLGTMQAQATSQDGQRVSSNNAFIRPVRYNRPNLVVRPNTEVLKVLINEHKTAYGIKYIRHGKVHIAHATKEVIVSGGTINSPKLLMLSGVGPRKHISDLHIPVIQDLPVGENLHDHVTLSGIVVALPNETATAVDQYDLLREIFRYKQMKIKLGPLSGNGPGSIMAFQKSDANLPAPDIQYQVAPASLKEYLREPEASESVSILPSSSYDCLLPRTMNVVPKSRGKLLLNPKNPHGAPLIYPNYLGDPSDLVPLLKGARFLLSLEHTEAFRSRGAYFEKTPLTPCNHLIWGTDEYLLCLARSFTSATYHAVGTCKMGPTWDHKAVVDPRLRVYGISGLRVIDASIMPVVVRGNTNAPSIMIGERGAALVLEDWNQDN